MRVIESDCCDCGFPCIYEACRHYKTVRYYCNKCREEVGEGELYYFGPEELCAECALNELEKVVYDDE